MLFLILRPVLRLGESGTQDKEGSEKEDIDFVDFSVYAKAKQT